MKLEYDFRTRMDIPFIFLYSFAIIGIFIYAFGSKDSSDKLVLTILGISCSLGPILFLYETYKLNRAKYRLDLFNRRYEIYTALITILRTASTEEFLSDKEHLKFQEKYDEAKFFFQDDVLDFLGTIDEKLLKYKQCQSKEEPEERTKLCTYFLEALSQCDKKFKRYLYFREP